MTAMSEISELKQAAEDALARGFAIFPCLPHKKEPFSKYAPNGFKNASRNPVIALKAWHDGEPANYGIACGETGLTVVDCDRGFTTYEDFAAWRENNNIPHTLTVRTGRRVSKITGEPEYGVQMYFSGTIATTGFIVDGVSGELKSTGGYVCGAGSIHPDSGEKYEIILDVDVVPLPEGFKEIAKPRSAFVPTSISGELVPAGNRWPTWQSKAGALRNMGVDPAAMRSALENIAINNFEDGANYVAQPENQEKLDNLVNWAFSKMDVAAPPTVITTGGSNRPIDGAIPNIAPETLTGDWIGDMTDELAKGTHLPPAFVRSTIKTILGASLDGMVGFPHHTDLHLRHWNFLIAPAETGKGVSWDRASKWGLANYMKSAGLVSTDSGWYSSGEHLVKKFLEIGLQGQRTVTHFDEMRLLFEKGAGQNSTLLTRMLSLYDRAEICAGSLTNSGGSISDASVSITGGFTPESFSSALSGKGVSGDGFLSRCVLSYCHAKEASGDWDDLDTVKINAIQQKMLDRFTYFRTLHTPESPVFVPAETPEAIAARLDVQKWFREEMAEDAQHSKAYCARLEAHFKRDLLLRTIFSDDPTTIHEVSVLKSWEWAKHELKLRRELWPSDEASPVSQMCVKITRAFGKREHITKAVVMKFCNVKRDGTFDEFNRAWKAMLTSGMLYVVGKTQRKAEVFGLMENNEEN